MSWNPLNIFKSINKTLDLVDKVVPDKDLAAQLRADLARLKEEVYMAELNTKTIPWVDALHKMQRGILSLISMGIGVYMIHMGISDPIALGAAFLPAGGYNIVKGRGRSE